MNNFQEKFAHAHATEGARISSYFIKIFLINAKNGNDSKNSSVKTIKLQRRANQADSNHASKFIPSRQV